MAVLELSQVTKRFGDFTAVNEVSFSVEKGEILSLLGPSGCGKTTTLRMIAGFEDPNQGSTVDFRQEHARTTTLRAERWTAISGLLSFPPI